MDAKAKRDDAGCWTIAAPTVGWWRGAPSSGALVRGGDSIGTLEILGVQHELHAPAGAAGIVVESTGATSVRSAVDHGSTLLVLDPSGAIGVEDAGAEEATSIDGALSFGSPMSGRFYTRPSPDKAPFVEAGMILEEGQTVCLLEVMKTFNRITYGGAGLPARAKVSKVVPADGDEVSGGEPLLLLETA